MLHSAHDRSKRSQMIKEESDTNRRCSSISSYCYRNYFADFL